MTLVRIKYLGMSDIREMSKRDLASAGVGVDGMLRWERANGWSVYVQDPSDRLLELLKDEGVFTVEESDDSGNVTGNKIVKGTPMDDTAATVVDSTTGASSTRPTGQTGKGSSTP